MSTVVDVAGTKSGLDGDLTTCSTTPGATCSGTATTINGPRGLAVDKHGNLYIMDEGNFAVRLANFTTGQLTTIVTGTEAGRGGHRHLLILSAGRGIGVGNDVPAVLRIVTRRNR